jgi:hypothetical protein
MRYKFSFSTTAFLLLTFFYLSGCTKKISLPSQGSDIPCKISFIVISYGVYGYPGGPDTVTFTYNSAGNPTFVNAVSTGSPNLQFTYDSHNRLTVYKQLYGEFNAEDWTIYQFANGSDQPAGDLTYENPAPDTGSIPPAYYDIVDTSTYHYDAQKRVSQVKIIVGNNLGYLFTITNDYPYDSHGNLSGPLPNSNDTISRTYDDKVNFRRLNPVFQFIDRDYSQNNSTMESQIYSYNEYGLPTHMKDITPSHNFGFLGIQLGECWIQYDCSCGIKTTVPVKGL